jgi:hypothetical protein
MASREAAARAALPAGAVGPGGLLPITEVEEEEEEAMHRPRRMRARAGRPPAAGQAAREAAEEGLQLLRRQLRRQRAETPPLLPNERVRHPSACMHVAEQLHLGLEVIVLSPMSPPCAPRSHKQPQRCSACALARQLPVFDRFDRWAGSRRG